MLKTTYDVFISYNSSDIKIAEVIYKRLVAERFSVWFDKARLNPGCNWHDEIEKGCEESRIILPILTQNWRKSEWTKFETYGAESVIPIKFEGTWHEVTTPPLIRYQGLTFDCSLPEKANWEKLYRSIRKLLSRPSPKKAERLTYMHYRANPYFVGREIELNKIHENLFHNPTTALTQGSVYAIAALGGIGKTSLARQYAEKFWRLYRQIFWVDARTDLVSEFAKIADMLKLNLQTTNANEKANAAILSLNDKTERLLILDNAEDEESIQKWIPKTGGCHTIITSRFAAWSPVVNICRIDILDPENARKLLLNRSEVKPDIIEIDAADRLAEKLGWLPLALEQAAAFIYEQGPDYGFQDYLRLYNEAQKELLNEGVLGSTEYPDSVITTWKTTIVKLSSAARTILKFSSFLSIEPIPIEMFQNGVNTILEGEKDFSKSDNIENQSSDEYYIRMAIKNLSNYSMITLHGKSFSVHGLVQTVERINLEDKAHQALWIEKTIDLLINYAPKDAHAPKTWSVWNHILSHALQLWEYAETNNQIEVNIKLPEELGKFYFGKGMYSESIRHGQSAIAIVEKRLGTDHVDLAYYLGNLGESFRMMHKLEEAEKYFRRALEISRKHYGENHVEVASDMNYLAISLHDLEKTDEAEQLCRKAIEILENLKTQDQVRLLKSLATLSFFLEAKNDYEEAESLNRRALDICEKVRGKVHPDTAIILNNLGLLHGNKGDYEEAESLLRQALVTFEKILGEDHPHTAVSLKNLADLFYNKGDYANAEPLYLRSLVIREKVLGKDHLDTATSLSDLARIERGKEKYQEAVTLYQKAYRIFKKNLGSSDPKTAHIMHELAFSMDKTGNHVEAEVLYKKVLAIWVKIYGNDNVEPINCMLNLQVCLFQQKSKEFDFVELKACTDWLKDRNDPRAEKGLAVIRQLEEE